jgi:hypothetical protein
VPANTASLLVAISGVVQDPTTYSVSSNTLTFSTAPPSASGNISVRYLGIATTGSSFSGGTTGLTPSTATTGAVVLAGTLNVANGGTGVTTSTGSGNNVLSASPTFTGTVVAPTINSGAATALTLQSAGTTAITIDTSQRVGIGTSSLSAPLQIQANSSGIAVRVLGRASDGYSDISLYNNANTVNNAFFGSSNTATFLGTGTTIPLTFQTNNAEAMRIDTSGNFIVGKTTSATGTAGFNVNPAGNGANIPLVNSSGADSTNNAVTYQVYSTSASAFRFYVGYGGTVYATSTTISGVSDQRFKENIVDLDAGLDKILALKPRKFDWKEGKGANTKNARGFIAQEFETVFPDLIDEWKDPAPEGEEPYKSVRADLIPVLVKAIQELNAKVDAQALEIQALKGTK